MTGKLQVEIWSSNSYGLARRKLLRCEPMSSMYKTLSPGAIGVRADTLEAGLTAAKIGGFDGLEFPAAQVADRVDQRGPDAVKKMFIDAAVRPAAFGLPVDWRTTEESWRRDLEKLPRLARA